MLRQTIPQPEKGFLSHFFCSPLSHLSLPKSKAPWLCSLALYGQKYASYSHFEMRSLPWILPHGGAASLSVCLRRRLSTFPSCRNTACTFCRRSGYTAPARSRVGCTGSSSGAAAGVHASEQKPSCARRFGCIYRGLSLHAAARAALDHLLRSFRRRSPFRDCTSSGLSTFPALSPAFVALALNSSAYVAEIFRAGILAVDAADRGRALAWGFPPCRR